MHRRQHLATMVCLVGLGLLGSNAFAQEAPARPTINIVTIENGSAYERPDGVVSGTVSGVAAEAVTDFAVVVYAYTDKFYLQPYHDSVHPIGVDGRWHSATRRGDGFLALLVRADYVPPTPVLQLPLVDGVNILASVHALAPGPPPPIPREYDERGKYARKWAVVVGINYEKTNNKLLYAEADARDIKALLLDAGFDESRVHTLIGRSATAEAIRTQMSWLQSSAKAGDLVLFYFSGHGFQVPDSDGPQDETDGLDEALVPVDGRAASPAMLILDDELALWASRVAERAKHLVIVLDTCYSGGATRGQRTLVEEPAGRAKGPPDRIIPDLAAPRLSQRVALLAACRGDQVAWEFGVDNGIFTEYIQEVWREDLHAVDALVPLAKEFPRVQALVHDYVKQEYPNLKEEDIQTPQATGPLEDIVVLGEADVVLGRPEAPREPVWIKIHTVKNGTSYQRPDGLVQGTAAPPEGASLSEVRVALYALTDKYYIQPFLHDTHPVGDDGAWTARTRRGNYFKALLVREGYDPPSPVGALPEVDGADVYATTPLVPAPPPGETKQIK